MGNNGEIFIGVDLGGTNIEAAAVRDGQVLASKKTSTKASKGSEVVIKRVEKVTRSVIKKVEDRSGEIKAICVGAPGAVDLESGLVRKAPNLDWVDVPLGKNLEERLGIPVFVDNDVNVGVAGEFAYGAGQGADHMVGIFVGTGIGGGVIINGDLHYGIRGAAGEIGHMVVMPNGRLCGCGKQGCVEAYASKTAMLKNIQEEIGNGRESALADLGNKRILPSSRIEDALIGGDELMAEVLQKAQFYLALLAANLVNVLDPDVIVFGGGVVEQLGESFIEPIRKMAVPYYLQQADSERIRILPAALGDHAGTIGAAVVAQKRFVG